MPARSHAPAKAKPPKVDYDRDVRPILAQHCFVCHGADPAALAKTGNMRLDTFQGATADRGGYRAITPGKPGDSRLLDRVTAGPDTQMPPTSSGVKKLSPDEVETIRTWISEGAEYRAHWAFVTPKMPSLPSVSKPHWVRNDIDRFILAKLDEEHLAPEPEADKRTLIRRVTLSLTGLPPSPAETEAFVEDTKPGAYERVVDRLLASPRFGENQGRYWLDAVRYADTHGLHIDNERSIFPYRDWVVRSYNEDLPYDKFVTWQIAGDLLPGATTEEKIATGYVRLNPTSNEGGAIEAEFLTKNTMDRVDTTSTVFLGLTLQCAKCHDHKFDPLSQKDYYSMYAFFDSTADAPLDGNLRLPPPVMKAPTPEQAAQLAEIQKRMGQIVDLTPTEQAKSWALQASETLPSAGPWEYSGTYPGKSFDEAYATDYGPETGTAPMPWKPIAFQLDQPKNGILNKDNSAGYLRSTITVSKAAKTDLRLGSDDAIKVWLNGKLVFENKISRGLTANADKVTVDLQPGTNQLLVKIVNGVSDDGAFVGFGGPADASIVAAGKIARNSSLSPEGIKTLDETYLVLGPDSPQAHKYRQLEAALTAENAQVPFTYIAKELPMPRPTFVLKRGQYDMPGDKVSRAIPAVFGTLPADTPHDRLALAKWIASPKNPLTARVMVNRIWQQHFGQGLVKSSEDFGTRGDWPSHPELLDYLACRFVQDGWSIKKLTRMIVTSAAFRQSSVETPEKRAKDSDNSLISRGPRFRLDAEVIRDSALFDAGLLYEGGGGHADKPYQPPGLWEIIAYPISDTAKYMQDHGEALYRRSIYLFWKRTSPPPEMMILDAPMRESCVVRRSRTNTPTQALVTLNETGFVEDARAMAQRVIEAKTTDAARLDYAFRLATGRSPKPAEAAVISDFLKQEEARYQADPADAAKTLAIGESPRNKSIPAPEHAAWMLTCNMILNLDEAITQH
jgi:mono/diheme cytochrome c family protein